MGGSPRHEDPLATAYRELEEETGLKAGSMQQLLYLHTSNSITDEQAFLYLATQLSPGVQQLEDSESDIQLRKLPLDDAVMMAQSGEITDALSVAGLYHLALNRQRYNIA